jgi:hypothetical protein
MIEEKPTTFFLDEKRKLTKGKMGSPNSHQYIPFGNIRPKIFTQIGGEYFGSNGKLFDMEIGQMNDHFSIEGIFAVNLDKWARKHFGGG